MPDTAIVKNEKIESNSGLNHIKIKAMTKTALSNRSTIITMLEGYLHLPDPCNGNGT